MAKDEIRSHLGDCKSANSVEVINCLKNRNIRLFKDTVKVLYGEGPYILSPSYQKFFIEFGCWKDMKKEDQIDHIKSFFNYIPPIDEIQACNNSLKHHFAQFRSFPVNYDANRIPEPSFKHYRKLPFTPLNLNIPEDHISLATLRGIFSEAEELINEEGGVTSAASSDHRMRTLKSKSSTVSLILAPLPKNPNYYQCKCPTFSWYQICVQTIATAEDNGSLFDYFVEIKKKVKRQKQKGLTNAIESTLIQREKEMKKNEIRQAHRNETNNRTKTQQKNSKNQNLQNANKKPMVQQQVLVKEKLTPLIQTSQHKRPFDMTSTNRTTPNSKTILMTLSICGV